MKKELIHSLLVLFTIVNGIIAAFALGITELIKYVLKDAGNRKGMRFDGLVLGNIPLEMGELQDNLGWVFLVLMLVGIIILVIVNSREKLHN